MTLNEFMRLCGQRPELAASWKRLREDALTLRIHLADQALMVRSGQTFPSAALKERGLAEARFANSKETMQAAATATGIEAPPLELNAICDIGI